MPKRDKGPTMTNTTPNPRAVNPRYQGLRLGDVARILTRPKNQNARSALDRLQRPRRPKGDEPTER